MAFLSAQLWKLLGPEGQKTSFLCHWLKTGESYPTEAQSLCSLASEVWSSGIINADIQCMKLPEFTISVRFTCEMFFYCLFIWLWVKFIVFFLLFSKLWKKALSPLAIQWIHIEKSLHIFHSRVIFYMVVVFLQSRELQHLCLWGENSLLECKPFYILCFQWGFLSPLPVWLLWYHFPHFITHAI